MYHEAGNPDSTITELGARMLADGDTSDGTNTVDDLRIRRKLHQVGSL